MLFLIFFCQAVVQNINGQPIQPGSDIQLTPISGQDNNIQSRFNYFDLELLRTFGNEGNYLISPASVKTTLGMILEGAKGKSAEEISDLLRIPVSQSGIREKLHRLLYDLTDTSGNTILTSANALFLSDKFNVSPLYSRSLSTFYNALVKYLNFTRSDESADAVNKWVSDATRGQIPQLVEPGSFDPSISAVIANALYFKGIWKETFNPKGTFEHRCFKVKGGCYETPMMHIVGSFRYKFIEELDSSAVELQYNDGKYAMLILLPNEKSSVDGLIRDLQHVSFSYIIDALEKTEVLVEIPKFEIEYTVDMVPALNALGIRNVFSANADLTGVTDKGNIKIDSIIQKAKISVNEEGTIAAAATGAVVVPLMGLTIPEVIADRPFLFFVYNTASKNIIFEGRFNQPNNVGHQTYQGGSLSSQNQRLPFKGALQSRHSPYSLDSPLLSRNSPRKGGNTYQYSDQSFLYPSDNLKSRNVNEGGRTVY